MGSKKQVIAELRDTGPAYKHGNITRRSEELTLFANFQASNYTYMSSTASATTAASSSGTPHRLQLLPHLDASTCTAATGASA